MNIDIRTMILITGITNLLQIFILFYQYLANKYYPGIGWWVLGFVSMTLGYVLLSLRNILPVELVTVIAANFLVLMNPVCLYVGVLRFLELRENRSALTCFIVFFVMLFLFFTYVDSSITYRTVVIYMATAIISLVTSYALFTHRERLFRLTLWLNSVLFLILGIFLAFRAAVTLTVDPVSGLFNATLMQTASFLFLFVHGILLTFGLIIMVNQRLNSENREAGENLEKIFNTSPDAVIVSRLSDGRIIAVNEGFTAMTGYTRGDVAGQSIPSLSLWIHPGDRQKMIDALVTKGFCEDLEPEFRRKNGERFTGSLSSKLISLQGVAHIISVTRDISVQKRAQAALAESEGLYRELIENAGQAILVVQDGRIVYANPVLAGITGYNEEDIHTRPFTDFLHPDDLAMVFERYQARMSGRANIASTYNFRVLAKDGNTLWFEINAVLIEWKGRPATLNFLTDITERRQTENLFRARLDLLEFSVSHPLNEVLQKTLDQVCELTGSSIGFYHFVEPDQKTLSLQAWSTRTLRDFCKTEGYGMHYPIDEAGVWVDCVHTQMPVIHNDYASLPHRKGMPEGHAPVIRELVVPILRVGKIVSILGVGNKPLDYAEKDARLVSFFADVAWEVAERKRAEAALIESETRYTTTLYAVNEGLWDWSVQSGRAYFSPQYYRILGYDDAEFDASYANWRERVHPDDLERVESLLEKSVKTGEGFIIDLRMKMKSGRFIWVSTRGKAIEHDADGRALRMVGTLSDISERKQAELYHVLNADVLGILNASDNLEKAIEQILAAIQNAIGCDAVGIRLQQNGDYPYVAQRGFSTEFLSTENSLRSQKNGDNASSIKSNSCVHPECACGLVIAGKTDPTHPFFTPGGSFWTNHAAVLLDLPADQDPRHNPRNQCVIQGYASLALMPIRTRQKIAGLLQINDRRRNQFSQDIIIALESIANHIGEALVRKQAEDALQESEEKYRLLLDHSSDLIWNLNTEGVFTYLSPSWERITGYQPSALLHTSFLPLVHPDDAAVCLSYLQAMTEGRITQTSAEYRVLHADGAWHWHAANATPVAGSDGAYVSMVGVSRDITKHKQAEEALKESEEKYRSILENMTEGYFESDSRGYIIFANDAALTMMGYAPHEREILYRIHYRDFTTPATFKKMKAAYMHVYQTGLPSRLDDYEIIRRDGLIQIHQLSVVLMRDAAGNKTGFRSVARDVTERKQAEIALRESEERFRQLAEVFPETIFEADLSGRLTYTNKHGLDKFQATQLDIEKGLNILDLVEPGDRSKAQNRIEDRIKGLTGGFLEYKARRLDNTTFDAMAYTSTMTHQGKTVGMRGFILDITERKRAEALILEARDRAEEASRAKSDFLSIMSHEIRTPLNAIIGMSELLEETRLSEEQSSYVQTFKNAGESLLGIINDILDYSKIEAGKIDLEQTAFNPADLVESVSDILAVQARKKGLEFIVDIAPDIPRSVTGDLQRLRQVLTNLIGNAVKFTLQGTVIVKVETADQNTEEGQAAILFSVTDTGIGIPADKMQYIFERFSQADTSVTRQFGGTGLGLAICQKLIELMGGRIKVESEPGQGSRFSFILRFGIPGQKGEEPPDILPDMSGLRAMVVDDNATNRLILNRTLTAWNINVTESGSGPDALEKLRDRASKGDGPYHLILIDRQMPTMDGVELARQISGDSNIGNGALVMMTSDSSGGDSSRKKISGVAGQLLKPIKQSDLKDLILNILRPETTRRKNKPVETPSFISAKPLNILHVEDAENNRMLIRSYFKNTPFRIEEAENGQIAVEKVKTASYDLILMDMQMPVMDGYTATRNIRKREKENGLPQVPIIALTAHVLKADQDNTLLAGCNLCLIKPVKKSSLIEAIRTLIPQAKNDIAVKISKELEDLIPLFMENTKKDMAAIIDALAQNDMDTVRRIGHSMKSYGSGYGFDPISAMGRSLEAAAKDGNASRIRQALSELENYLGKVTVIYDE